MGGLRTLQDSTPDRRRGDCENVAKTFYLLSRTPSFFASSPLFVAPFGHLWSSSSSSTLYEFGEGSFRIHRERLHLLLSGPHSTKCLSPHINRRLSIFIPSSSRCLCVNRPLADARTHTYDDGREFTDDDRRGRTVRPPKRCVCGAAVGRCHNNTRHFARNGMEEMRTGT